MGDERTIRIAQSCAADPRAAAEELHQGLAQPDTSLVLFFCSSEYDRDALADEIRARFGAVPVVGCTTAGEIGPMGCRDGSLTGVSFAPSAGAAVVGHLDDLQAFSLSEGRRVRERPAAPARGRGAAGGRAQHLRASCSSTGSSATRSSLRTRCRRAWATSRSSAGPPATA